MAKNTYTGRTIINIENRNARVFPAMQFCVDCQAYTEHSIPPPPYFDDIEGYLKTEGWYDQWIKEAGFAIDSNSIFNFYNNNKQC